MRIKSVVLLSAILAGGSLFGTASFASGIFDSFIVLNINGGGNTYFDLDSTTGNDDFNGFNLGNFNPATDSLNVAGGQLKTYEDPDATDNATGAEIFWRVYKVGDVPGSFVSWGLAQIGPQVGNDRTWEATNHSYNELTGLTPGDYKVEAYGAAYFSYDNGQGQSGNFTAETGKHTASFTVIPEPGAITLTALSLLGLLALRRRN